MRRNMKKVLQELGSEYVAAHVDLPGTTDVYRDFGNGIDVEIQVPYYSRDLKVDVFIWKDQREIIDRAYEVPLGTLTATLEHMYKELGLEAM